MSEGSGGPIGPGEAARRLGVSTRTVQRWLREGRLAGVRVGSRLKVDPAGLGTESFKTSGSPRPIRTLLVANRGEIVARIARTCRLLGIRCLALVAADQEGAWWTEQADERIRLEGDYLDITAIVAAAREASADAIHPGYGFLAENPAFAEAVTAAGVTWVGPPSGAIRLMGDKVAARRLAARQGVPLLPGSDGRRQSDRGLAGEAERIGYPVLIKPVGGGGGKGMHVARTAADLRELLARARREAGAAFGDDRLLIERYLDRPRHVEIQVLVDGAGTGIQLGERECSLQRRHQKVVEESPSPVLRPALRRRMDEAALRVAAAAGYVGAGTVEFLLDDERGEFFFLEVNTRLQVEHPVTELVTGRDLVADQLAIAAGARIAALPASTGTSRTMPTARWGHAIEARLYAEDAEQGFLPANGRVVAAEWPAGEGIRVDAGVGPGDEVGTRYDPLLAKIIVGGTDRRDALRRLREALDATVLLGPVTNLRFLRWIAAADWFARGQTFTDTVAVRWHPEAQRAPLPEEAWRTAAGAIAAASPEALAGWRLNVGPRLRLRSAEEERSVEIPAEGPALPVALVSGSGPAIAHVDVDGRSVAFTLAPPPTVDSAVRHAAHPGAGPRAVTAPMPGRVIAVAVHEGDRVELHQPLVVLEAMKMENAVTATADGVVTAVLVRPGGQVQKGDLMVEIAE